MAFWLTNERRMAILPIIDAREGMQIFRAVRGQPRSDATSKRSNPRELVIHEKCSGTRYLIMLRRVTEETIPLVSVLRRDCLWERNGMRGSKV
jgi:hypothetical protein